MVLLTPTVPPKKAAEFSFSPPKTFHQQRTNVLNIEWQSNFNLVTRTVPSVSPSHVIKWWQWMWWHIFENTSEYNCISVSRRGVFDRGPEITVNRKDIKAVTMGYLKFEKTHAGPTFTRHLTQTFKIWNEKKREYMLNYFCDLLRFCKFLHKYYAPSADSLVM